MKTKNEEFEVLVPNSDGDAVAEKVKVVVPLIWDEEVKEWLLTPEAHQIIEDTKARLMGLLLPAQLKELRERYNYTQKEMGELFQIGEKSWTRWESGKHRPSRSINLIIRALYEDEISIDYLLKRAGKPPREFEIGEILKASWSSILTTDKTTQMFVTDRGLVQFQSAGGGKSAFLKAVLHHSKKRTPSPWADMSGTKDSQLVKLGVLAKRFDYEKAKIA